MSYLGKLWGTEERWVTEMFRLVGWKAMLELTGWEIWASSLCKDCQRDPSCSRWRGEGRKLPPRFSFPREGIP